MPGRRLLVLLPLGLAGACSQPGSGLPPLEETARATYRVGSGDVLRVIVFGDPRLNGEFRVNDDGTISLPLAGAVPAAAKTARELEASISGALQTQGVLRNPQVAVEVVTFRPFFILGEVERPGQYPFQPGMTVLTAVAIGGGFTYRANRDFASITRVIDGQAVEGKVQRQSFVQPGDVITVFERRF
ncbi:MAG: polysaccharide export protein [Acetobacteraceae bacterium]|nr:polysaccharide export protein [Acetobacteraceae bacterium]